MFVNWLQLALLKWESLTIGHLIDITHRYLQAFVKPFKELTIITLGSWIRPSSLSQLSLNVLSFGIHDDNSDFIQLKDIMIGRKTWDPFFAQKFGIKEHFITAMDRLYVVRKPLAHGRPIGNGQRLHLYLEGVELMRTLGVKILKH